MRRLPWGEVLQPDRRMIWTAVAIALCAAFAIVSFAVPAGLQTRTVSPAGPLAIEDAIVSRADGAPFEASLLDVPNATLVFLREDLGRTFAALDGPAALPVPNGTVRPAALAPQNETYEVGGLALARGAEVTDVRVGTTWLLLNVSDYRAAFPSARVAYALAPDLSGAQTDGLMAHGFVISHAPGVQPFFESSVVETSTDLLLIVVFSSSLVVLFAFEFVRSEIRSKRPQIGLWRAVGMRAPDVVQLLLARTAMLALAGYLLGLVLALAAFVAAALIGRADLLLAGVRVNAWLLLAVVFVAASLAGAAWPAWAATHGGVRAQMEAPP